MNELETLKKEVAELKAWKASLESSQSIPLNIDQAFRDRFIATTTDELSISPTVFDAYTIYFTTPDDGDQEAAGAPDVLLQVTINNSKYKIPAYGPS